MDSLVRIPMKEGVESLNVAAAAAILLFDAARVSRLAGGS
jgi:tRNA G18 (ribose-2'-O)-methylase SpoU